MRLVGHAPGRGLRKKIFWAQGPQHRGPQCFATAGKPRSSTRTVFLNPRPPGRTMLLACFDLAARQRPRNPCPATAELFPTGFPAHPTGCRGGASLEVDPQTGLGGDQALQPRWMTSERRSIPCWWTARCMAASCRASARRWSEGGSRTDPGSGQVINCLLHGLRALPRGPNNLPRFDVELAPSTRPVGNSAPALRGRRRRRHHAGTGPWVNQCAGRTRSRNSAIDHPGHASNGRLRILDCHPRNAKRSK